jgi:isopenicillin-N N-acyltransferase-like protein
MSNEFLRLAVSGRAEERGFQHGQLLADRIGRTVEFYTRIFGQPDSVLFELADHFKRKIREFDDEYATEIESVAEGAGLDSSYIYALNARSELLSLKTNECTAIYFQKTGILGQNWDWASVLEPLTVLMRIEYPNGHVIQMITEPGIIGKIGLNSSGIGVCLNILRIKGRLDGLPVHVLLRSILDSKSIDEAKIALEKAGQGKASNILVADRHGNCFDIEFARDRSLKIEPEQTFVHTNHYIGEHINPNAGIFRCSYARKQTAEERIKALTAYSVQDMKSILLDRSHGEFPINRRYTADDVIEEIGTVCSVIMDLPNQTIHLKRGHAVDTDFSRYTL